MSFGRTNFYHRGMTIVETVVALSLLAMGMVATVQVLGMCAQHGRASQQLMAAQLEAANVQRRFAAMPYNQVTNEVLRKIKLSSQTLVAIPGGGLTISLNESSANAGDAEHSDQSGDKSASDKLPHKRIRIEVSWPADEGPPHSVGLTVWKFAPPKESTP